jgi:hypothetical protein
LGLFVSASITLAANSWPREASDGGCSSFCAGPTRPMEGSIKATAGSFPAAASAH